MSDEKDIADVIASEASRGSAKRHLKRVLSLERKRTFGQAARMLGDSNCTFSQYEEAIREIEPTRDEYEKALKLWNDFRGKS
jgi:flagellar biosynthesis chaperone FliJ